MNHTAFFAAILALVCLAPRAPAGSTFQHVESPWLHGNPCHANGAIEPGDQTAVLVLPVAPAGTTMVRLYPVLNSTRYYACENLTPWPVLGYDGAEYANWAIAPAAGAGLGSWACSETVAMCGGAPLAPYGEDGDAHSRTLSISSPVWTYGSGYTPTWNALPFLGDRRSRALRFMPTATAGLGSVDVMTANGPAQLGPEVCALTSSARLQLELWIEYADSGDFCGPPGA